MGIDFSINSESKQFDGGLPVVLWSISPTLLRFGKERLLFSRTPPVVNR